MKTKLMSITNYDELADMMITYNRENEDYIVQETIRRCNIKFNASCHTAKDLFNWSIRNFMMDCGWVDISFVDQEITNHIKKVMKKSGYVPSEWLGVFYNINTQSTTIANIEVQVFKEVMKEKFGLDLVSRIVLD